MPDKREILKRELIEALPYGYGDCAEYVIDFIEKDRQRIVEPLIIEKTQEIRHFNQWGSRPIDNAVDEVLKRAGIGE